MGRTGPNWDQVVHRDELHMLAVAAPAPARLGLGRCRSPFASFCSWRRRHPRGGERWRRGDVAVESAGKHMECVAVHTTRAARARARLGSALHARARLARLGTGRARTRLVMVLLAQVVARDRGYVVSRAGTPPGLAEWLPHPCGDFVAAAAAAWGVNGLVRAVARSGVWWVGNGLSKELGGLVGGWGLPRAGDGKGRRQGGDSGGMLEALGVVARGGGSVADQIRPDCCSSMAPGSSHGSSSWPCPARTRHAA